MNTEKEQKVLDYLDLKEKEPKFVYKNSMVTVKQILTGMVSQGFTKEKLIKDINEYNNVISGVFKIDLSEELLSKLKKVVMRFKTQRRIFIFCGDGNDLPQIDTIL